MVLSMGKKIAAVAATAALALGGAAAVASADTSAPTTSAPTSTPTPSSPTTNAKGHRGLLRRADHGDVEVRVKGTDGKPAWVTVTFDRGKVTAVSQSSITLARPDGQSVTLPFSPTIKYQGVSSWQEIATGKGALVISRGGTATRIVQPKAKG